MKHKSARRFLSLLLTAVMLVGCIPAGVVTVSHAAEEPVVEKSEMDQGTYEALGFQVDLSTSSDSYMSPGNQVMNAKKELYFDYNGSSHYGWTLRDNLSLYNRNWTSYETIGAYKLYGQYQNGDWAHLNAGNGYTYGNTGGLDSLIGSGIDSTNHHLGRAYETATAYKSASGKEDRVAKLIVYSAVNRVDYEAWLELVRFVKGADGKYTEQHLDWQYLGNIPALDESGEIFNQRFDALFDIAAGDFNGDGVDEVAVYYGTNQVEIYQTKWDYASHWKTIGSGELMKDYYASGSYPSDSEHPYGDGTLFHKFVERALVITLTAGDLKKDYTEDLVITMTGPQNATTTTYENPTTYIYGANSADSNVTAAEFTKDYEVLLTAELTTTDGSAPQVFRAANAAIGDLNNDSCMELVIGGRLGRTQGGSTDTGWSHGGLIHVEYDHAAKSYVVDPAWTTELNEYDEDYVLERAHNNNLGYYAPVGMAIADLDGVGSQDPFLYFFAELFTYDVENRAFANTGKYIDTIKNQTNNADEGASKSQHWVSDVVVGNFNNNENRADQIIAIVGCKENGSEWYWYYMSYVAMDEDGNYCAQCEGIINQGRSYLNNTDGKSRASTYVSVAAPDVDDDGILMEHIGTKAYYSKPEVQAVLQSAPYFQDVADVYDNYLNNGTTAYGTSKATGEGGTASVSASLGIFVSSESSALACHEMEMDVSVTTSYDHATIKDVETSMDYAGDAGDDYVVMYTIPYYRYYYDATFPDGSTDIITIEEPMTPATVIVPVETYDALAATTQGLEPIRGNILTNIPGDPASYSSWPKGTPTPIGEVQMLTNAGPNSGSTVTVSRTVSTTKEHSFSIGIEENLEVGFGGGALGNDTVVGIQQGFAIAGGGTYSKMDGVAYTGTVDNLPYGVEGYAFNWQLGITETTLNGEDIIVVAYKTSNVKQAPSLPQNLSVSDITSGSVTLEWGVASDAALFEVYVSRDQDVWLPLDPVPATMADEEDNLTYTINGLSPGTTYYFRVKSADAYGVRSLETNAVTATTLGKDEDTFSILSQPADTSAAVGKSAKFEVSVRSSSNATIYYQWQYASESGWKNISGKNGSILTVENITQDMDGRIFRCLVSQGANYFYTKSATLTVSKSPTEVQLDVTAPGKVIVDGSIVQASAIKYNPIYGDVTVWNNETVTAGGVTYTKKAVTEEISDSGYTYTGPFFWSDPEGNLYAVTDSNGVGNPYSGTNVFYNGTSPIYTVIGSSELDAVTIATSDEQAENGTGITVSIGYALSDGTGYVYCATETVAGGGETETGKENGSGTQYERTEYYAKTSTYTKGEGDEAEVIDIYSKVTLDTDAAFVTVNGTKYLVNSLSTVKEGTTERIIVDYESQTVDGDQLTLAASNLPGDITGSVYFQITNMASNSTKTVNAVKAGENWTASYTFDASGVYQITAVYGGDSYYFGDRSTGITVYVNGSTPIMTLNGGSVTYGGSLSLEPVIHSADSKIVVANAAYTVTKDGKEVTGVIRNGSFEPKESGTYVITAACSMDGEAYTADAEVKVYARTLTIAAKSVSASLNDSEADRKALLEAEVSGLLPDDAALLSYTLNSEAVTSGAQGDYRIDVTLTSERTALEKKYSLVLTSGTFTLEQGSVRVNAGAVANGNVVITYTTTVSDSNGTYTSSPLTVESGSLLPKGANVTITAIPNSGFGVSMWVVNGYEDVSLGTGNTYVIENIQDAVGVKVYFTQVFNTLSFTASGDGVGAVTGAYKGDGATFNSGDKINVNQVVVLTATPAEGNVIAGWTCQTASGQVETLLAEDGESVYTGSTYTVSGVAESATYTVSFAPAQAADVTINFVDKDGNPVPGANVVVNEQNVAGSGNTFVYSTSVHDNLDIKVSVPGNMLIDSWKQSGQVVAGATDEMTIYNLGGSVEYTVVCTTPNARNLTFGAGLVDTNGGEVSAAGTITADRSGMTVASGASLPQGVIINFTAAPAEGYRVSKWTVNGSQVAGVDTAAYQLLLDNHTEVKVYFEKKPVITLSGDANGSMNAQVGSGNVASGGFVEFGSDVQINIIPSAGYVVNSVQVNGVDVTASLQASGDNRYFICEDVERSAAITVTYKAKPIVTLTETTDRGEVTMEATRDFTEEEIASGDYVDFGSGLTASVDPDHGYVVGGVTVNGEAVTLSDVANSDCKTFSITNIQADVEIVVTYTAIDTISVTFGVVDKAPNGGLNGTIAATVDRKGMDSYSVEQNTSGVLDPVYRDSTVTFTVVPEEGYKVSKWFLNGEEVDQQPVITYTGEMGDQAVMVQFDLIGESIDYSIIGDFTDKAELFATYTPNGGLTQDFASGNQPNTDGIVEITVNELDENYEIEGWYLNGEKQLDEDGNAITAPVFTYQATVDVGAEINVKLIRCSYQVTFSATNGTVTAAVGETTIASGDSIVGDTEVTFTAQPKEPVGYEFVGWLVNGASVDEETETLTIAILENVEVEAVYRLIEVRYSVEFGVVDTNGEEEGGLNGTLDAVNVDLYNSPITAKAGSNVTFNAACASGYRVAGWYSDAEGVTPIAGTAAEQMSYTHENLVAPLTVYVKFEPIPEYTIDVAVTGDGAVTATVNGKTAEIAEGKLVVKRYDDVVLTAVPGQNRYLTAWTVDGEACGNSLTLEFADVTADKTVTADFASSQNVELKTEVIGGSIIIKAGFGEDLEQVNPETGIIIHKGQNVELILTPDAGKMLDKWIVNGVEQEDWLEHELRIENIDQDTTIRVVCVDEVFHSVPADDGEGRYVITDIVETPEEYGTDRQIRDRGNVSFVVKNLYPNLISAVKGVTGGESSTAAQNPDGSWTITVTKVTADIVLDLEIIGGKQLNVTCGAGGEVIVTLNGETITNDRILAVGDEIVIKARPETTYMLESLTVNDTEFASGKVYTVKAGDDAINVAATFKARPAGGGGGGGGTGGGGGGAPVVPGFTPDIPDAPNGDVIVLPETPAEGDTVIVNPVPDKYYGVDEVEVVDGDGQKVDVTKIDDGIYSFVQPDSKVTIAVTFKIVEMPFVDVPLDSYFADAVLWAANNGITAGTSATTFSPDMTCTRAQAVTFLWRAAGSPTPKSIEMPFEDVAADAYYYNAVLWAMENGVTAGTSETTFSPDAECTRAHIVTFLWRAQQSQIVNAENPFEDVSAQDYYIDAVLWAVEKGITAGTSETTFSPDADCTRAHIVTFLWRCFNG